MNRAWPFLYGRGRERGYRLLIIPGLVKDSTAGLGWLARAVSSGRAGDLADRTPDGLAVRLAVRLEVVDGVLDEFGRPLRISYGLVGEASGGPAAAAALAAARELALAVYREFLDTEHSFEPRVAPLLVPEREPLSGKSGAAHRHPAVPAAASHPAPSAVPTPSPSPKPEPGPGLPGRRRLVVLVGAAVVALLAFLLVTNRFGGSVQHSLPASGAIDLDRLTGADGSAGPDLAVTRTDGKIYLEPVPGSRLTKGDCQDRQEREGRAQAVEGGRFCAVTTDGTSYDLRILTITRQGIIAELNGG